MCFGSCGAVATALLGLAGPGDYLLAALLFIVAEVGFSLGNIFYDAFLPTLAGDAADLDRLSSRGYALGYVGGGLALLLAFILIQWHGAFGLSDTLTRLQQKYRSSRRAHEEQRVFENLQLRFRQVHGASAWWPAMCEAAQRMDFAWVSLKTIHPDGRRPLYSIANPVDEIRARRQPPK